MSEPFASTASSSWPPLLSSMNGSIGLIGAGAVVVVTAMAADYFVFGPVGRVWLTLGFVVGFGLIGLGYLVRWRR